MVTQVLNVNNIVSEVYSPGAATQVSAGMFGGISINQVKEDGFSQAVTDLGLNHIRWPGGALSEGGGVDPVTGAVYTVPRPGDEIYFSLNPNTHPELVHPAAVANGRDGLSDMLAFAIESGSTLSVTLPTQRYVDDPSQAYSDVLAFLERLYVAGDFNGGNVPPNLIFDVGSEHYDPTEYGLIAIEMITALADFRSDHPDADFQIALQTMQTGGDTLELIDVFETSSNPGLLGEVDIVRHHVLDLNLDQIAHIEDQSSRYWAIMRLQDAIKAANGTTDGPDLYFSAWTTESDDAVPSNELGLPAAGATLSLFATMVEMGADYSAAWGIGAQLNNATRMSYFDGGTNVYSPSAEVYRLMSESLVGTSLIATDGLDDTRSEDPGYHMFAYADDAKIVIFLAADDFDGSSLTVDLELLGLVGGIGYAWAERVGTVSGTGNGEALVAREAVGFNGTSLSFTFTQDYEVIRLIIARDQPGDGYLHLWGTEFGDALTGGNSGDLLEGQAGHDTLQGGSGNDTLDGGAGDDVADGGGGADTFVMGITRAGAVITATATGYRIVSSLGTDELTGVEFVEFLDQTLDLPTLPPPGGPTPGADVLTGTPGNDLVFGGSGDDTLMGGSGDDTLQGGSGDDTLQGGPGSDHLEGGAGTDTADYSDAPGGQSGGVRVDLEYSSLNAKYAAGDTFDGIENVIGSDGQDYIAGDGGANHIVGGGNVDFLIGRAGDDTLDGGAGNDVLYGGTGADHLIGGPGSDRAHYGNALSGLVLDLGNPANNTGQGAGDSYDSVEEISGGLYDDTIYGDGDDNRLFGFKGAGADRLYGRGGDDYLNGGAGADTLDGGAGTDTLRGGAGADRFVFNDGADMVEDFDADAGDRLALDAAALGIAGLSAAEIVAAYAEASSGQVVLDFGNGDTLTLEGLSDTAGLAAFIDLI